VLFSSTSLTQSRGRGRWLTAIDSKPISREHWGSLVDYLGLSIQLTTGRSQPNGLRLATPIHDAKRPDCRVVYRTAQARSSVARGPPHGDALNPFFLTPCMLRREPPSPHTTSRLRRSDSHRRESCRHRQAWIQSQLGHDPTAIFKGLTLPPWQPLMGEIHPLQ